MDHERLMDDIAAHYILITQQHPGISPDELVTLIVDRVSLDAELRMATAEQSAGSDEGWAAIQRFVSAMEYFEDEDEDVEYPPRSTSRGHDR